MEEGGVVRVGLCRLEAFDKHAVHHGGWAVGTDVNHYLIFEKRIIYIVEKVKLRASILLKRKRKEFLYDKSCWSLRNNAHCGNSRFLPAVSNLSMVLYPHPDFASEFWRLVQTLLPGGRNSGQKAQKGPQKKKVCRKNLWPNFSWILPGRAERGRRKFSKEVPYF